jgi:serine/threonine-protein kinase RsbW
MGQDMCGGAVDRLLESTLESVDSTEEMVLEVARQAGFAGDDLGGIGMAVRESMVNAVVHGNRYSKHKKVHLVVSCDSGRLTVKIADEGEGFDSSHLPDPREPENLMCPSGRGIFLIRSFMDEFHVRPLQPAGTEVTLVKYLVSK